MATVDTVWGIDIGQCALKALKLRDIGEQLQVEAFDIIEHPTVLSQPDADRRELIRNALDTFLSRNDTRGAAIAIAVPGQSSFTRFIKLPPVESKKIPDIVRFEAEQQIPFPIADVVWRWQTFDDPDTPDIEAGIFAMKRSGIAEALEHFTNVNLNVDIVQMAPLALYNFMIIDGQTAPDGATLLVDIGTDKTDLVVSDRKKIWTRTVQIGGSSFTDALVRAFKLSFRKAEKLKRTAATSKYARQIFQAMRPVFANLAQEIQRSVGYYTSLHRDARFKRLVGLGNGFRLPGMQKYLEQNLNMPVVRIDNYNRLRKLTDSVHEPTFAENALSLGVAYGLASQGLRETQINTNLLPDEVTRKRIWNKKRPWFAAAAALLLTSLCCMVYRAHADGVQLRNTPDFKEAKRTAGQLESRKSEYRRIKDTGGDEVDELGAKMKLYGYRNYWPSALWLVHNAVERVATDQKYLTMYAQADKSEMRKKALQQLAAKRRTTRRLIVMERLEVTFHTDVTATSSTATGKEGRGDTLAKGNPGFEIKLTARTPLTEGETGKFLPELKEVSKALAGKLDDLSLLDCPWDVSKSTTIAGPNGRPPSRERNRQEHTRRRSDTYGENGIKNPDPLLPDEDSSEDTRFWFCWIVTIDGDGVKVPEFGKANGAAPGRIR